MTLARPPLVEVAIHCILPVTLFQPSTIPPVLAPNIVDVAMNVGTAEPEVLFARIEFAAAAPKEVALLPDEVTAPLMLAFVVTVAAVPPILSVEVETEYDVPLFTPTRPESVPRTGALVNV